MDRHSLSRRWTQLAAQLPRPHRDGASLPTPLLRARLQKLLDGDTLHLEDLVLHPDHGELRLTLDKPLPARLTLDFVFLPVDWPRLSLRLSPRGESTSASLLTRAVTALAFSVLQQQNGHQLLQRIARHCPWMSLDGDVATIHLDRIAGVARYLEQPLLGRPLGERLHLAAVEHEDGALRLRLAAGQPRPPADR